MQTHEYWFNKARDLARDGGCLRAKCGAVIIKNGEIIGQGYNAPPKDDQENQKCENANYDRGKKLKYDLTCCVHAEWRALTDALQKYPEELIDATLYYVRLDENKEIRFSGEPFCTVCSRLALDLGLKYFALWHESGIVLYDTKDYNDRSYAFHHA